MSEIIDIIYYGLKQMIMILGKYWYKHHEDGKGNLAATIVEWVQGERDFLDTPLD